LNIFLFEFGIRFARKGIRFARKGIRFAQKGIRFAQKGIRFARKVSVSQYRLVVSFIAGLVVFPEISKYSFRTKGICLARQRDRLCVDGDRLCVNEEIP
jgi:hypothetical protein